MKERPILFSAPMVRAILAGTKTQTRRAVQLPEGVTHADVKLTRMQDGYSDGIRPVWELDDDPNSFSTRCPYGQRGDRLWVREACVCSDIGFERSVAYRADGEPDASWVRPVKWRPSIHMPRWACRIVLEVTGVRVERLQDISEADAIAEGCSAEWHRTPDSPMGPAEVNGYTAVEDYAWLWESLNGARGWTSNPWVWVVEFRRVMS